MKKNFYILFLLISSYCFSQTYEFDILTKYISTNTVNNKTSDIVNYFNSSDYNYTLSLAKSDIRFVALLYDNGRNLIHSFNVLESKDKGEILFEFKYDYSVKKKLVQKNSTYIYEFSKVAETSPQERTLKIFKNKKSKKPLIEQKLVIESAKSNFFPIYQQALLSSYPSSQILPENFIVTKAFEECNKCSCTIELADYKKVAVEIILPTQLTFFN